MTVLRDELGNTQKEGTVSYFKVLLSIYLDGLKISNKTGGLLIDLN